MNHVFCMYYFNTKILFFVAQFHQLLLEAHLPQMLQEMPIEALLKEMKRKHLLSPADLSSISNKTSDHEQIEELLHLVQWGSGHMFRGFQKALKKVGLHQMASDLGKM